MNLLRRANPSLSSFLSRAAESRQTLHPLPPNLIPRLGVNTAFQPNPTQRLGATADHHRSFSTSRRHLHSFPPHHGRSWFLNTRFLLILSAGASYYYYNLEPVPYTNRFHFLLLSPAHERKLGNFFFDRRRASLRVLPADHPATLRVRRIFNNVADSTAISPKKHLEGMDLEVIVVRDDHVNAYCAPGGKIVVYTGLLDFFRTDAEIATVIGHEVGHAIARHSSEMFTKVMALSLFFEPFFLPQFARLMLIRLLEIPYSRRMETEADYIGLLLLASAGYDPRVAPKVYQKYEKLDRESGWYVFSAGWGDYLSSHPPSKERAEALVQTEVMEEALAIYKKVKATTIRGVVGGLINKIWGPYGW